MSATRLRDQIYSRIHAEVLRPKGFRKTARWIHRQVELFHFAIERPQLRFESPEHATFGLEVYVFHESYHSLMIGWPTFPGVDRMSIPVFNRGLRWIASYPEDLDRVVPSTDVAAVSSSLGMIIESTVLPLFERASTLPGLTSVVTELAPESWQKTKTLAGLLIIQGLKGEARTLLNAAITTTSGSARDELIRVESKLFANDA